MGVVSRIVNWSRLKSPWLLHFNTGACNACDIEIVAALTPRYDIERFGAQLKGTPRHADILLCSGPVTRKITPRLKRIYEQMPEPKYVIAMGACAVSGGPFYYNSYAIVKGADHVIPVDVYVPGCPPRPEAFLYGLMQLQKKIKSTKNFGKVKYLEAKPINSDKSSL